MIFDTPYLMQELLIMRIKCKYCGRDLDGPVLPAPRTCWSCYNKQMKKTTFINEVSNSRVSRASNHGKPNIIKEKHPKKNFSITAKNKKEYKENFDSISRKSLKKDEIKFKGMNSINKGIEEVSAKKYYHNPKKSKKSLEDPYSIKRKALAKLNKSEILSPDEILSLFSQSIIKKMDSGGIDKHDLAKELNLSSSESKKLLKSLVNNGYAYKKSESILIIFKSSKYYLKPNIARKYLKKNESLNSNSNYAFSEFKIQKTKAQNELYNPSSINAFSDFKIKSANTKGQEVSKSLRGKKNLKENKHYNPPITNHKAKKNTIMTSPGEKIGKIKIGELEKKIYNGKVFYEFNVFFTDQNNKKFTFKYNPTINSSQKMTKIYAKKGEEVYNLIDSLTHAGTNKINTFGSISRDFELFKKMVNEDINNVTIKTINSSKSPKLQIIKVESSKKNLIPITKARISPRKKFIFYNIDKYLPKNKYPEQNYFSKKVLNFKDGDKIAILNFAEDIKSLIYKENLKFDIIIPIPSSSAYNIGKGNKLLVERLAKDLNIQNGVNILQRIKTVKSSHLCNSHDERPTETDHYNSIICNTRIDGKKVLLFDDIYTQGNTSRACNKRILEKGASEVTLITLGKTI